MSRCFFVVKSLYRKQIDELTKDSRIQKWVFATPEVEIDDPTGEIRRLKKQVHTSSLAINSSLVEDGGRQILLSLDYHTQQKCKFDEGLKLHWRASESSYIINMKWIKLNYPP